MNPGAFCSPFRHGARDRQGIALATVVAILFVTVAAIATVSVQLVFYFNLFWSMFWGKKATDNPWEATTLEWTTATPPPHDNFAGHVPVVYRGPYEFSVPGAPKDYVMQTDPTIVAVH